MTLQRIWIPPSSVFICHGYVQYSVAEYSAFHTLRYHINFVPIDHSLGDDVLFAYNRSIRREEHSDAESENDENVVHVTNQLQEAQFSELEEDEDDEQEQEDALNNRNNEDDEADTCAIDGTGVRLD